MLQTHAAEKGAATVKSGPAPGGIPQYVWSDIQSYLWMGYTVGPITTITVDGKLYGQVILNPPNANYGTRAYSWPL